MKERVSNTMIKRTWAKRLSEGSLLLAVTGLTSIATAQSRTGTMIPPSVPDSADEAAGAQGAAAEGAGATEASSALDLSESDVVSIDFGPSDASGYEVISTSSGTFPAAGSDYLVMSTGNVSSAFEANDAPDTSTELAGLNNSQGQDLVQVNLVLRPPHGATCLAFDFKFFSEEFPEYVGSQYNDAFIAEIDQGSPTPFQIVDNQIVAPDNFAFDENGGVISVNTAFGVTEAFASGTTYDGASPPLTAVTPLEQPGGTVKITLSITDLGDSIYDSTAFVDNFRWFYGLDCKPGADTDSDGDGLLDGWEEEGIDFDNDGTVDLDLPAMGADSQHKDVFIEIDYMVEPGPTGHTHKPKANALQIFIDAFENAPVSNPDGETGIHAHVDAGPDTIMNPVTGELWNTRSQAEALTHQTNLGTKVGNDYDWTAFDGIKGAGAPGSFIVERADVFHYAIFAHSLAPADGAGSGISRGISASDFLVTLGGWAGDVGSVNEQAGTLMHEFGHNLGLRHGGDENVNYKPNYLSVMRYRFQTNGLVINGMGGNFDYSRFVLPTLNESALDETVGLSGVAEAANYGTRYFPPTGPDQIASSLNAIDWNNDGDALDTSVAVDVNRDGRLTPLTSYDDWDNIIFDGGSVGHLGEVIELPTSTPSDELTEPEAKEFPVPFRVSLAGPGLVSLQACESNELEVTIANEGEVADVYQIMASTDGAMADVSGLPTTLALAASASQVFVIPVTAPAQLPLNAAETVSIQVTSNANSLIMDTLETFVVAAEATDGDSDGLTDFCDACPASDTTATIVVGDCDTGVFNQDLGDGCYMRDAIGACITDAANAGAANSCVTALSNDWRQAGLIRGNAGGAIQSCVATSNP